MIFQQESKLKSICSNCGHRYECVYSSTEDTQHCAEHHVEQSVIKEKVSEKQNKIKESFPTQESNIYKGLCKYCEQKENCCYKNAELGIWHCEDYC
ncbi:hypothetical protein ACFLZV_04335 [Candidatus Margulisiibacteriota bacterium]